MPAGVVDLIIRGTATVGIPGVLAIGMMFLLHQGLGILRGIQTTLEDMHAALKDCACPFVNNPLLLKETINARTA